MLITVSGVVGSGKTTVASAVADRLSESGTRVELTNFQNLPCFRLLKRHDATSTKHRRRDVNASTIRRASYSRKPLTVLSTCVHVGRILSFRAWRVLSGRHAPLVLNRYFYDSLGHYELDGAVAGICLLVIRAVMPRPDVAVVLATDVETLATRRPEYARQYLDTAAEAYRSLPRHFPELIAIASGAGATDEVLKHVQAWR